VHLLVAVQISEYCSFSEKLAAVTQFFHQQKLLQRQNCRSMSHIPVRQKFRNLCIVYSTNSNLLVLFQIQFARLQVVGKKQVSRLRAS
jgi:hypothetical protein